MTYALLTDELADHIAGLDTGDLHKWVVLVPHARFLGHWSVDGFADYYRFDLREVIGSHRIVSAASLPEFFKLADEYGYHVAFAEDPEGILEPYRALSEPPPVWLDSPLEGTVNGLLPFQARGFNFLRDIERGGVAQWSTGTGKSALQAALLKYHRDQDHFRVCWSLAKGHNKINTVRTYETLAGIEAVLVDGTADQRQRQYDEIAERSLSEPVVVVTNYEKFRDFCEFDKNKSGDWTAKLRPEFRSLFHARSLFLWDEMPTKLKTRSTKLYRAVQACLYDSPAPSWEKRRAPWLRQYMFSATPIENSPEDWFNCVRLLDPGVYGTVKQFHDKYVSSYSFFNPNQPERWHRLDEMQLEAAHIVHQADKERDPEIRAQFPAVLYDPRVIDWNDGHRATYNKLISIAGDLAAEAEAEGTQINLLALITMLQMYCDIPSMVADSAALREAWEAATDDADENATIPPMEGSKVAQALLAIHGKLPSDKDHTKLLELRGVLRDEYPDEKVIIFSRFAKTFLPRMSAWLKEWNVEHVIYTGNATQLQEAQDRFKSDPKARVFLSSDRGSDSINLEEARVLVNYDSPLLWSRWMQRSNRNNRITSQFDKTVVIDLMMASSVELRVQDIIARKRGYHDAVFGGVIADQSVGASLTKDDLAYILGV